MTTEMLKAVPALKDLSEDALKAITTLSANDENGVIAKKVSEIHGDYDRDIKDLTGKDKPGGVKTYDHLKSILTEYKETAEKGSAGLQSKIDTLERDKAALEKKIKEGAGDAALREKVEAMEKDVADKENRVKALQKQLDDEKTAAKKTLEEKQAEAIDLQFDFEFQRGLTGVKFKDEKLIPAPVRETFINHAIQTIKAKYKRDFIDKDGKRVPVFRDEHGMIVNNPDNLQNPYTPADILLREIDPIIDGGSKKGGGTGAGAGGGGSNGFAPGSYKNKVEATAALRRHLVDLKLTPGTEAFQEAFNKEWADNKLSDLPME